MNELIKNVLPWIGTALGGPLGGAAANFIGDKLGVPNATVEAVKNVLGGMSPEKLAEFKVHDQEFQEKMAELGYDNLQKLAALEVQAADSVNKTMQTEATSEHWPTYSWRPAIGFAVAFNIWSAAILILIVFLFRVDLVSALPNVLTALAGLNATAMPILGIASWFRGKAQADPMIQTTMVTQKG